MKNKKIGTIQNYLEQGASKILELSFEDQMSQKTISDVLSAIQELCLSILVSHF